MTLPGEWRWAALLRFASDVSRRRKYPLVSLLAEVGHVAAFTRLFQTTHGPLEVRQRLAGMALPAPLISTCYQPWDASHTLTIILLAIFASFAVSSHP